MHYRITMLATLFLALAVVCCIAVWRLRRAAERATNDRIERERYAAMLKARCDS